MEEKSLFKELKQLDEVLEELLASMKVKPRIVEVPVARAYGFRLAQNVYARMDVPPFTRSELDGYAVRSEDIAGASEEEPVELRVTEKVRVGDVPRRAVEVGTAIEVATGAPLPPGADAVVPIEHTTKSGENRIKVHKSFPPWSGVVPAGSDVKAGALIARVGDVVTPGLAALIASTGIVAVKVYSRPRVDIYTVGDELLKPGEKWSMGKIYDANYAGVAAEAWEAGAVPFWRGKLPDSVKEIAYAAYNSLKSADIVVICGGTSLGSEDRSYEVFAKLPEARLIAHGLAMRPGKPTAVGVVQGKPVFILPGHPVSAAITFMVLVRPVIEHLTGGARRRLEVKVPLFKTAKKPVGKVEFMPVLLAERSDGEICAYPIPGSSANLARLALADGYAKLPADAEIVNKGSTVDVEPFRWGGIADLVIIGQLDPLVQLLASSLKELDVRCVEAAPYSAIRDARALRSAVVALSAYDVKADTFNTEFFKKEGLEKEWLLYRGVSRKFGLIFARGLGIKTIEEAAGLRFASRLPNTLERMLENRFTKGIGIDRVVIASTDFEAAHYVLTARADAAFTFQLRDERLGFLPLCDVPIDFLVKREGRTKAVEKFLEVLSSREFKNMVKEKLPEYSAEKAGELVKLEEAELE